MLELKPLEVGQYRQVAEWEFGPQPDDMDWERYYAEMNAPQWLHYGIYEGADFIGCISLERQGRTATEFHVVTARRKVNPYALAELLRNIAAYLFNHGFLALTTKIPKQKRAATRLAIRCGMVEWGHTPALRLFMLTKNRFDRI